MGQDFGRSKLPLPCLSPLVLCKAAVDGFVTSLNREERRDVANGESPACEQARAELQLAEDTKTRSTLAWGEELRLE
jgi:hypothetical protein